MDARLPGSIGGPSVQAGAKHRCNSATCPVRLPPRLWFLSTVRRAAVQTPYLASWDLLPGRAGGRGAGNLNLFPRSSRAGLRRAAPGWLERAGHYGSPRCNPRPAGPAPRRGARRGFAEAGGPRPGGPEARPSVASRPASRPVRLPQRWCSMRPCLPPPPSGYFPLRGPPSHHM